MYIDAYVYICIYIRRYAKPGERCSMPSGKSVSSAAVSAPAPTASTRVDPIYIDIWIYRYRYIDRYRYVLYLARGASFRVVGRSRRRLYIYMYI